MASPVVCNRGAAVHLTRALPSGTTSNLRFSNSLSIPPQFDDNQIGVFDFLVIIETSTRELGSV
jgi:hypothetical protein